MIIEGVVAFSNLTKEELYQGRPTGKYSFVVALDDSSVEALQEKGVKLKVYQDKTQRKFVTKKQIPVIDTSDSTIGGEIPWGSKVRLSVALGPISPIHGPSTYLNAVRVLELSQNRAGGLEEGF
jgi:hypothetical protein